VTFNLLVIALGSVLCWLSKHTDKLQEKYQDALPDGFSKAALAAGALLIIVGLVGFLGAWCYEKGWAKCLLFIYGFLMFAIIVLMLLSGIALMVYIGRFHDYADSHKKTVSEDNKQIDKFVKHWYDECCPDPSKDECKWIPKDTLKEDCANFDSFKKSLSDYVADHLRPLGIFALSTGIVLFVLMCCSCGLMCRKYKKKPSPEKEPLAPRYGDQPVATYAAAPVSTTQPIILARA
jgi:hypothetical protein